jgi:hypothetical protein
MVARFAIFIACGMGATPSDGRPLWPTVPTDAQCALK